MEDLLERQAGSKLDMEQIRYTRFWASAALISPTMACFLFQIHYHFPAKKFSDPFCHLLRNKACIWFART